MKQTLSIKALVLACAIGTFGATGTAMAYDDGPSPGEAAVGIIGEVIGGAIEAEAAREEAREHERRCRRWRHRCDDGEEWACRKYYRRCED